MSASALSSQSIDPDVGLRPVRLREDLGQIADLIEMAFSHTIDASGRAAIREMRTLSRSAPLLWLISMLDRTLMRSLGSGFVWVDPASRQLVGNVSLYPAGYKNIWAVANVAVHPQFRQRGIARALMERAMDALKERGATEAILQVEADNTVAQHLYKNLNFRIQRTFTRWRRRSHHEPPGILPDRPHITLSSGRDWKAELALAQQLRPPEKGGMGWLRPTEKKEFRRSIWQLFFGPHQERFIIRDPQNSNQILGMLRMESRFGMSYVHTDLLVHPETIEMMPYLLNYAIRYQSERRRGILINHPSDDRIATALFREYDFYAERHLTHMNWIPDHG